MGTSDNGKKLAGDELRKAATTEATSASNDLSRALAAIQHLAQQRQDKKPSAPAPANDQSPGIPAAGGRVRAMRLLAAIYETTGGRGRGVRDVTELETGLTPDEAREAWRDLLGERLIERFSQEYAARLSPSGVEFIESGQMVRETADLQKAEAAEQARARKVLIARGTGTGAREAVAQFLEESMFRAVPLHEADEGRSLMEQVEAQGAVEFAVVLLSPDDLGGTQELRPPMSVLMELGYFIGRLGRSKVCAFAVSSTLQLPKDLAGVVLESFDPSGDWKAALTRQFKNAGLKI